MKKLIYAMLSVITLGLVSCDQFNEASDAQNVIGQDVKVSLWTKAGTRAESGNVTFGDDMLISMDNYTEGLHYEQKFSGSECVVKDVVPGVYSISVSGTAYDEDGFPILLMANIVNRPILASSASGSNQSTGSEISIEVKGAQIGNLVFSEVYYCGSNPWYFRDQFYEIANNSDGVQYLDGLYFANTDPIDFNKVLPIWPAEDEDGYVYASRVWKFPGEGTDYPLQPGESCIVAQFAANHKLPTFNPNCPIDGSQAEFEFYMNSATYTDQPAENMLHVFYDGSAEMGSIEMYLTSVFGVGLMVFRVPEGVDWDPVHDSSMSTTNLGSKYGTLYAKVPVEYVVDAVECVRNASYNDSKNFPAIMDGGFVTVGSSYLGVGVTRLVDEEATAASGHVKYKDTNNSVNDFESGVVPVMHRHSTAPAWSHVNQ